METRRNSVVLTFQMKWLCYSQLSLFATAKWFVTTWLVLWKIPDAVLVRYAVTIPNKLCSLFAVCFHLFQPTTESIGADITGGERKIVVSSPPFFRNSAGTIWEFRTRFLPGFFQSSTEFSLKWPNKLSQFGHYVQNIRLVNTVNNVSICFNTIARKTTERTRQKKLAFARSC